MKKGESSLLLFYAGQLSFFRPALKTIENKTSLSRAAIYKAQKNLEDDGLIEISKTQIKIDWEKIKTFAMIYATGESHNIPKQRRHDDAATNKAFDPFESILMSPKEQANIFENLSSSQIKEIKKLSCDILKGKAPIFTQDEEDQWFFAPENFLSEEDKAAIKEEPEIDWSQYILSNELPF